MGDGLTAEVYKIESIETGEIFALKVIKNSYLMRVHTNRLDIQREMKIADILSQDKIVRTIDSGENGFTNSGLTNIMYIVMEYIPNQIFDLIKISRNVGEEGGRMFLR